MPRVTLSSAEQVFPCISALAGRRIGDEDEAANGDGLNVDGLLQLLGKLSVRPAQTQAAALDQIGIEALDLAGPDDLVLNHRAGGGHLVGFAGALGVGAVAGHKQPRGRYRAYGVNHMVEGVGAAPGHQKEGGMHKMNEFRALKTQRIQLTRYLRQLKTLSDVSK